MRRVIPSQRLSSRGQKSSRAGFTLIEILLAITILAGVVLTMAMNTTMASRKVASSGVRSRAQAIVDQQISRARMWPTYSTLSQLSATKYNQGGTGLTSSTVVESDTTNGKSITTVKVTVTGNNTAVLPASIVRSISIAAP